MASANIQSAMSPQGPHVSAHSTAESNDKRGRMAVLA